MYFDDQVDSLIFNFINLGIDDPGIHPIQHTTSAVFGIILPGLAIKKTKWCGIYKFQTHDVKSQQKVL